MSVSASVGKNGHLIIDVAPDAPNLRTLSKSGKTLFVTENKGWVRVSQPLMIDGKPQTVRFSLMVGVTLDGEDKATAVAATQTKNTAPDKVIVDGGAAVDRVFGEFCDFLKSKGIYLAE